MKNNDHRRGRTCNLLITPNIVVRRDTISPGGHIVTYSNTIYNAFFFGLNLSYLVPTYLKLNYHRSVYRACIS